FALSIFCLEADVSSQQKGAFPPPREHTPNIPLRYRNAFPQRLCNDLWLWQSPLKHCVTCSCITVNTSFQSIP
ncbi:hypothetical protein KUCAC02_031615, partial [Chaenocephalus aceratus]